MPLRCFRPTHRAPALLVGEHKRVIAGELERSPAAAAREHGPGHLTVYCETWGCRSTWYKPRHERRG